MIRVEKEREIRYLYSEIFMLMLLVSVNLSDFVWDVTPHRLK